MRSHTLTSCLAFLYRSRSMVSCSSMRSLTRFASASRWRRRSRSWGVSPGAGRRTTERGSSLSMLPVREDGLWVEIIVCAGEEGGGCDEEEEEERGREWEKEA